MASVLYGGCYQRRNNSESMDGSKSQRGAASENIVCKQADPTLPVAPQQASRASSMTTLSPFDLLSSARNLAADAPVIPEPTMTTSASFGKATLVRCPSRNSEGSLCQKEAEDFSEGRLAMLADNSYLVLILFIASFSLPSLSI